MTIRLAQPLLVLALAARLAAQSASVPLSVTLPDGPSEGARLFSQKGCARCHSMGAGARIGPDLGSFASTGNVLELTGAFWNHAPVMRTRMEALGIRRPSMTPAEMADLVAFLTAFRYYDTRLRAPGNPAAGREVFVGKGCAGCHEGPGAWGTPGPDLQKYRGRDAPIFLAQAMWNHSTKMSALMQARGVAWPVLSGRELGDLTAYLRLGASPADAEPMYFEPGSPRRGQSLFADKGCATCHAIAGKGGQGGPELGTHGHELVASVADIAALMWNHRQRMHAEFVRRGVPFVTFGGQEMADIIAYLYFINYAHVTGTPDRGRRVFAEKCAACHVMGRKAVGPDLTVAPGLDKPIGLIAAMWNHAAAMEAAMHARGLTWPRMEPGDTADLAAYIIANHQATPARYRRLSEGRAPSAPDATRAAHGAA